MLTLDEVAQRLNLSPSKVRKDKDSGILQHYKFGGAIRVSEEQFSMYVEMHRVEPAQPRRRSRQRLRDLEV